MVEEQLVTVSEIDAVVVTSGDTDMRGVLASLEGFRRTIVWNNRLHPNLKVFGRYVAAQTMALSPIVYVQDDDVVIPYPHHVVEAWRPNEVCANMPPGYAQNYEGTGIALVGFGCVFHRNLLLDSFASYLRKWPFDELFMRECDRIFTFSNNLKIVNTDIVHLPWATQRDRMYLEQRHDGDLKEIKGRLAEL